MNQETFDCRTRKQKFEDFKANFKLKAKQKWNGFANWVRDNKDVLLLTVPVVVTATASATKVVSKSITAHTVQKEIDFKERTIYDRSLGRYAELKRPLTNDQALIIEQRRQNGEKLSVILNDMHLVK